MINILRHRFVQRECNTHTSANQIYLLSLLNETYLSSCFNSSCWPLLIKLQRNHSKQCSHGRRVSIGPGHHHRAFICIQAAWGASKPGHGAAASRSHYLLDSVQIDRIQNHFLLHRYEQKHRCPVAFYLLVIFPSWVDVHLLFICLDRIRLLLSAACYSHINQTY